MALTSFSLLLTTGVDKQIANFNMSTTTGFLCNYFGFYFPSISSFIPKLFANLFRNYFGFYFTTTSDFIFQLFWLLFSDSFGFYSETISSVIVKETINFRFYSGTISGFYFAASLFWILFRNYFGIMQICDCLTIILNQHNRKTLTGAAANGPDEYFGKDTSLTRN